MSALPEADLLELTDEQRDFAIERYVALDVYQRFALDLGKVIQDKRSAYLTLRAQTTQVSSLAAWQQSHAS